MQRGSSIRHIALAAAMLLAGCEEPRRGPIVVSAIGEAREAVNPNLDRLDPAAAFLLEATAQGLVRFDAAGQVEPALAQSWIVSDDGLRYTFRLSRTEWSNGEPVTADQVVARLQAAMSRASSNRLKPILGVVDEIEAMTHNVLEISLKAPRANFLQILAQPELAIMLGGRGTGPYLAQDREDGSILLSAHRPGDEEVEEDGAHPPEILLRPEPAPMAVARFERGLSDLVIGGTAGSLPIVRAAEPSPAALRFDPVAGLFGLAFTSQEGPLDDPAVRRALSMAVDRAAIVAALAVPELQARQAIVPAGLVEPADPAFPDWAALPQPQRAAEASQTIAAATEDEPLRIEVALPEGPGYRLIFAHLQRDWRAIGVEAVAVPTGAKADLMLIDEAAPAALASWYLRALECSGPRICVEEADALLDQARTAAEQGERRRLLAEADRLLTDAAVFIPITTPIRWSLVSPRLTGFQPNPFGRRAITSLVQAAQ